MAWLLMKLLFSCLSLWRGFGGFVVLDEEGGGGGRRRMCRSIDTFPPPPQRISFLLRSEFINTLVRGGGARGGGGEDIGRYVISAILLTFVDEILVSRALVWRGEHIWACLLLDVGEDFELSIRHSRVFALAPFFFLFST